MDLSGLNLLLTVVAVAITLPAKIVSTFPSSTCPNEVASFGGIQNGSRPTMFSIDPVIEVEFNFYFQCHDKSPPTFIDHGVRLEFRLQSAVSFITTDWLPIRFYAPSLMVAGDYTSLVELDPSNISVTAQTSTYSSSFPLTLVGISESATLIREYICIQYVQNFTEDLNLQLRWMQRFGKDSQDQDAEWILDDINIRIWNGTSFLEILSEDFSEVELDQLIYGLALGGRRNDGHCKSSNDDYRLLFKEKGDSPTTRFLTVNLTNLSVPYKETANPTTTTITMVTTGGVATTTPILTSPGGEETTGISMITSVSVQNTPLPTPESLPSEGVETTTFTSMGTTSMTTSESIENTPLPTPEPLPSGGFETTTLTTMGTTGISMTTSESVDNTPLPTSEPLPSGGDETTTFTTMGTTGISTTISESVVSTPFPTPEPLPNGREILSEAIINGVSPMMAVQKLLEIYEIPLTQAVSDNVISIATDILTNISSETHPEAGGFILEFLDIFILEVYSSSLRKFSNDILSFQVIDVQLDSFMNPGEQVVVFNEGEGMISLPVELFSAFFSEVTSDIVVVTCVFKNLSGILPEVTDDGKTAKLASSVLSITLRCKTGPCMSSNLMLKNPVLIEIHHFVNSSDNELLSLYFFDLKKNIWSSRGCSCKSTLSNPSFSVCESNHLTHFAILLSPGLEIDAANTLALKTIGYVGITFSVICMIAVIFTLTFLKALWGMRTYIHINLCVCLIISQVIFISAIDKTSIKEMCQAIAIVLHYFFLTTFMWMLMEGVFLYVMLVQVFIKRQYLYMVCFTMVSYGLPALYVFCVALPLGLTIKDEQGLPQYGSSKTTKACWLRYDKNFNWAFISPVIVIIIINIGFFIMAITIMWKHNKRSTDKSILKNTSHWVKTAISLLVVMGITWIIGILVFDEALIFVAYIFTIVTAFQGTFIFILFVVLSKQVKHHYGSWWRAKKGESEFLNKLFSSSKEIHSSSYSGSKKRKLTKTTDIGKETATRDAASSPQYKKKKVDNSNGNVSKFGNLSSNVYVSVHFTNNECVDHNESMCELEGIYVNQSTNNPEECSERIPEETVGNAFPSQEFTVNCTAINDQKKLDVSSV